MRLILVLGLFSTSVSAFGAAGHEIVATIAQILLTDRTQQRIAEILPEWTNGHLAKVAPWADQIKSNPWWRSWSSGLHFVNPINDWPSTHCEFGESGWINPDRNIFTAINNYTHQAEEATGATQDIAIRFLVHFLGDLHQPLHLTGREKGGNGIKVRFEHRVTNLHSVWDTGLITKAIREQTNYTQPVPEERIERALRGAIYDPYIRWIAKEGLLGWWKQEYPLWALCPGNTPTYSGASDLNREDRQRLDEALSYHSSAHKLQFEDDPDLPVCPKHWGTALHNIDCEIAFPPQLDHDPQHFSIVGRVKEAFLDTAALFFNTPRRNDNLVELNTPEYAGRIRNEKIMEKLLAMGGVRLAAVLNDIFDPSAAGQGRLQSIV